MAADMFLKIDGIDGESSSNKHKGEIELLSFSWGLSQSSSTGGGGGGAGKVQVKEFTFVKEIDKASPKLMEACCTGEHIRDVTLTLSSGAAAKGSQEKFMTIKFTDVLISSYQTGGGTGGSVPMDQVSFSFSEIIVQPAGKAPVICNFGNDLPPVLEKGHDHSK
jgi:type VI secretion system secreted protein Hcp